MKQSLQNLAFQLSIVCGWTLFSACSPMQSYRSQIVADNQIGSTINGSYCTTWTQWTWKPDGTLPVNLVCLQPDGSWSAIQKFPEEPATSQYSYFGNASLTQAENGDLLLGYARTIYPSPFETEFVVSRFHSGSGWTQVNSSSVNSQGTSLLPAYSQFGGLVFELRGIPRYFWTQNPDPTVSTSSGSTWTHLKLETSPDGSGTYRHPGSLISAAGTFAYLYYGEPLPKVWKFDGTSATQVGNIPVGASTESTLYTSMVEFNGFPVIAFTSNDFATKQNWDLVTDVTKIFAFDGTNWNPLSSGIQDTPGHDGVNPFLFTIGDELYVMYADYTTDGLPKIYNQIQFRFRVKKWTGSSWVPVGQESEPVNLSQRFEFLNDSGTVLVNVIRPSSNGIDSEQVLLSWQNGRFVQMGSTLRRFPNSKYVMTYRPGATIKLKSDGVEAPKSVFE